MTRSPKWQGSGRELYGRCARIGDVVVDVAERIAYLSFSPLLSSCSQETVRTSGCPRTAAAVAIGQDRSDINEGSTVILLCYDGSEDARAAADPAAKLFAQAPVTVLTVWERYVDLLTYVGFAAYTPPGDVEQIDAAAEEQARGTAQEGAERLRHAGIAVESRTEARQTSVAATILATADEIDADAIVLGTRGLGGLKSLLLGSVSHAIVQHAARPVVIVPSEAVAHARAAAHQPVGAGD